MTTQPQSQLSTRLNSRDLLSLKQRMPNDWAEKVKLKTGFGLTKIREVLRTPDKYHKEIIDAALEVASDYKLEIEESILSQKQRIKDLNAV